jgi:hypothetical protein
MTKFNCTSRWQNIDRRVRRQLSLSGRSPQCSSPFSRLALHGTLFPWGGPQQWPGLALAQGMTVTVARGRLGGSPTTTTTLKSGKATSSTEWPLSRPCCYFAVSSQWAQPRASSGVIMITILAAIPQLPWLIIIDAAVPCSELARSLVGAAHRACTPRSSSSSTTTTPAAAA